MDAERPAIYRPRRARANPLWQCVRRHLPELRASGEVRRVVERNVLERFLDCGDPHQGFARIRCGGCGHELLLAFSCKTRYFCPSCHQKRVLAWGDWVEHPGARPGFILFVQTFGDLVNFNPHIHALVADGVFEASGRFVPLPPIPEPLLAERLRRAVLGLLVRRDAIDPALAGQMLSWRHSGFSVHNRVRVAAADAVGRKSLAGYMLRAPFSLEKMSYDAARGAVIYRSRLHATLKRNFQAMPGVQWLELLCKHIPDRN
ncbi:MAG: transposase zinc-binding domain-containing protein, partial [Burkholderiales bacterium]|nr:transposase zinc-binding domain-containing protein [Burkholderiales bacterium]